jgi:flagellar motor switch protein FliN
MTQAAATAGNQKSLIEEYAAEVTPPAGEAGAAPGSGRKAPAAEARKATDEAAAPARNLDLVMRIPVTMKIVLGSATMPVSNLMKLGRGSIIPLERRVGEPIDVVVNGRVIARGEVVVVDEATSRFGIKLTEVIGPSDSDKAT